MSKCDCSDYRHYFKHHEDYIYWQEQRGRTVRITRGAFEGDTGRLKEAWGFTGSVVIPYKETVSIHYDDLKVMSCSTEAETYWRQQIGKKVRITKGAFVKGCTGILRDCGKDEGRVVLSWSLQDFLYDELEVVVEPLTHKDIGKKFLVIRGILKGQEGQLRAVGKAQKETAWFRFDSATYTFWSWIPVDDLEPVD